MGGAFSRSNNGGAKNTPTTAPKGQITDVDRAILDLKNTRDRLTRYSDGLEASCEKLVERAKAAKQQQRARTALGLLRLKKYKQTQVEQVQTQLLNVHQMIETIDSQQRNAQIVDSMKAGKDALAKLHAETTVEDVLNLMDEIQEEHALEQEYADILNSAVPGLTADQEDAVEAELAALQAEMEVGAAKTEAEGEPTEDLALPTVPTDKLPDVQQPADAETAAEAESQKQPERVAIAG